MFLWRCSRPELVLTLYVAARSNCGTNAPDVNHAQLIADDSVVLLSERNFAAIAKYNLTTEHPHGDPNGGTLVWRIGGSQGTWPIVDFDGTEYMPGETVWANQHNPEFISDDEICMFDCTGLGNESRLLIVHVDEEKERATLRWQHKLGVLSQVYGDCDPLPSGNLLASYWKSWYSDSETSPDEQAVAGLVEVVKDSNEIAWHMRVYGTQCPHENCHEDNTEGWHMYSVERFYDAPLFPSPGSPMGGPHCAWHDDELVLSFTTFNSFKQNSKYPGQFKLTETSSGRVAAKGAFTFEPFWRPTKVMGVPVLLSHPQESRQVTLEVTNERGRGALATFNCTR